MHALGDVQGKVRPAGVTFGVPGVDEPCRLCFAADAVDFLFRLGVHIRKEGDAENARSLSASSLRVYCSHAQASLEVRVSQGGPLAAS